MSDFFNFKESVKKLRGGAAAYLCGDPVAMEAPGGAKQPRQTVAHDAGGIQE